MTNLSIKLTTPLMAVLFLAACEQGAPPQFPPPQVNVAQVVQTNVQLSDEFSGRIEAIDVVELRPRVSGYLSEIHFDEGSSVRSGQLLFSIDDREYVAAVNSAKANVARAQSRVTLAQTELERSERLLASQATSQGEVDQRIGEIQQAQADLDSAQAALASAELNLGFTQIHAPMDGRIGAAMVKPGNLVSPGTSLLSTVVSVDPIYVTFEADEQVFLKYQRSASEPNGGNQSGGNSVQIGLANEEGFPHSAELVFVDNALNPNTGTILAKALLSNEDGIFTPGLYARVQLFENETANLMLINEIAVANDQDRRFVYVLGENNLALRKDVELGAHAGGLRVVTSGLTPEDMVVVNGRSKIFFPGMPVDPITVPMDQPEQAPLQPPSQAAGDAAQADH